MTKKGFGPAFTMGTLAALGIGIGLFLSVIFADMTSEDGTGDILVIMLGVVAIAFTGAVLIGAVTGIVAGLRSTDRASSAGAGFLAGAVGHFIVLFLVFLAFSIVFSGEESADGADEEFSWSEFGEALLFLVPAAVTSAITALSVAPGPNRGPASGQSPRPRPASQQKGPPNQGPPPQQGRSGESGGPPEPQDPSRP